MGNDSLKPEESWDELSVQSSLTTKELKTIWKQFVKCSDEGGVVRDRAKIAELSHRIGLDRMVFRLRLRSTGKDETAVRQQFADKSFREAMQEQGAEDAMVDMVLTLFDANQDGGLDFREAVSAVSCVTKGTPKEKARLQFKLFDVNGDNEITFEEVAQSEELVTLPLKFAALMQVQHVLKLKGVPIEKIEGTVRAVSECWDAYMSKKTSLFAKALFDYADTDHDGKVTLDEYVAWQCDPKSRAAFALEMTDAMKASDEVFGTDIENAVSEALDASSLTT
jgi:Ca2+-binding EF-hand superfamily protein